MAVNEELLEEGSEEVLPEAVVDEASPVLYVEEEFDPGDISAENVRDELEGMEEGIVYISPPAFARMIEREAGKHQAYLYDVEGEVPDNPELPEFALEGIEEVAEILSDLPAESGRIDVRLYDREGDPQYLRTHTGEISDQVFERFERGMSVNRDYALDPADNGYVLEF